MPSIKDPVSFEEEVARAKKDHLEKAKSRIKAECEERNKGQSINSAIDYNIHC